MRCIPGTSLSHTCRPFVMLRRPCQSRRPSWGRVPPGGQPVGGVNWRAVDTAQLGCADGGGSRARLAVAPWLGDRLPCGHRRAGRNLRPPSLAGKAAIERIFSSGRLTRLGWRGHAPMRRWAVISGAGPMPDATSTTLYFGPWYRKSPFFEATLRWGCSAYDMYNHMYLPAYYDDLVTEYWALVNDVTLWDVGVERVVQISGPDGFALDEHAHLPRPDQVRGRAGQVCADHRPRRRHRQRPGAAAPRREHLLAVPGRQRRPPVCDGARPGPRAWTPPCRCRRPTRCRCRDPRPRT